MQQVLGLLAGELKESAAAAAAAGAGAAAAAAAATAGANTIDALFAGESHVTLTCAEGEEVRYVQTHGTLCVCVHTLTFFACDYICVLVGTLAFVSL
jgi:hypothetical protein